MKCAGCECEIEDTEEAIEVCCDKLFCIGCAVRLTPRMKDYLDHLVGAG